MRFASKKIIVDQYDQLKKNIKFDREQDMLCEFCNQQIPARLIVSHQKLCIMENNDRKQNRFQEKLIQKKKSEKKIDNIINAKDFKKANLRQTRQSRRKKANLLKSLHNYSPKGQQIMKRGQSSSKKDNVKKGSIKLDSQQSYRMKNQSQMSNKNRQREKSITSSHNKRQNPQNFFTNRYSSLKKNETIHHHTLTQSNRNIRNGSKPKNKNDSNKKPSALNTVNQHMRSMLRNKYNYQNIKDKNTKILKSSRKRQNNNKNMTINHSMVSDTYKQYYNQRQSKNKESRKNIVREKKKQKTYSQDYQDEQCILKNQNTEENVQQIQQRIDKLKKTMQHMEKQRKKALQNQRKIKQKNPEREIRIEQERRRKLQEAAAFREQSQRVRERERQRQRQRQRQRRQRARRQQRNRSRNQNSNNQLRPNRTNTHNRRRHQQNRNQNNPNNQQNPRRQQFRRQRRNNQERQQQFYHYQRQRGRNNPQHTINFISQTINQQFEMMKEQFQQMNEIFQNFAPFSHSVNPGSNGFVFFHQGNGSSQTFFSEQDSEEFDNSEQFSNDSYYSYEDQEMQEQSQEQERGLSHSQIRLLTTFFYQKRLGADDQCTICLNSLKHQEQIRQLPCAHFFHIQCIDEWLLRKTSCPVCREDIIKAFE